MTNTTVNNTPHYYVINGVKVFLADASDMVGVEPFRKNYGADVHAYRLEDYRDGIDTQCTYYESYGGEYPDDGYEICIANVVNEENDQYVLFFQWICLDELEEVNEELNIKGFDENDIPNEFLSDEDNKVLDNIKKYELSMSNTDVDYQFSRIICGEEATLYLFQFGCGVKSSAIAYSDGTTYVLSDWQNSRPETFDEVEDYDWVLASDGRKAVILNGLPRVL